MKKQNIVLLGATGSMGTALLSYLKEKEEFEVVGITLYSNVEALPELVKEYPSIKTVGIVNGDKVHLDASIQVIKGDDADIQTIEKVSPNIVIDAIWGSVGFAPMMAALKKGCKVYSSNREALLFGCKLLGEELTKITPIDPITSCVVEAKKKDLVKDEKVNLVFDGGPLKNYPLDKISQAYNTAVFKTKSDEEGKRIAVDNATGLAAFKALVEASLFTQIPVENLFVEVESTGVAKLRIGEKVYASDSKFDYAFLGKEILKESAIKTEPLNHERYPMFLFLLNNYRKYGTRILIASNAADEIAIGQFLTGKIRFSDIETVIRRVTFDVIKNRKNPSDLDGTVEIDTFARKRAKTLCESLGNSIRNGLNLKVIKKNRRVVKKEEEKEFQKSKDDKRRKKLSRWRNDPSKKELWAEHEKKRKERKLNETKQQALEEKKSQVKVEEVQSGAFPVMINDYDASHRLHDEQHSYPTKKPFAKHFASKKAGAFHSNASHKSSYKPFNKGEEDEHKQNREGYWKRHSSAKSHEKTFNKDFKKPRFSKKPYRNSKDSHSRFKKSFAKKKFNREK